MARKKAKKATRSMKMKTWIGHQHVDSMGNPVGGVSKQYREPLVKGLADVKVFVTEIGQHPSDAAIEKVREWCQQTLAAKTITAHGEGVDAACREILSLLPAKKGRKK